MLLVRLHWRTNTWPEQPTLGYTAFWEKVFIGFWKSAYERVAKLKEQQTIVVPNGYGIFLSYYQQAVALRRSFLFKVFFSSKENL